MGSLSDTSPPYSYSIGIYFEDARFDEIVKKITGDDGLALNWMSKIQAGLLKFF